MRNFIVAIALVGAFAAFATPEFNQEVKATLEKLTAVMERMESRCEVQGISELGPAEKEERLMKAAKVMAKMCSNADLKTLEKTFSCVDDNDVCFSGIGPDDAAKKCGFSENGIDNLSSSCLRAMGPQAEEMEEKTEL